MHRTGLLHRFMRWRAVRKLALKPVQQEKLDTLMLVISDSHRELQRLRRGWLRMAGELLAPEGFDRRQAQQLAAESGPVLQAQLTPVVESFGQFYDSLDEPQRRRLAGWWQGSRCLQGARGRGRW